MAFGLNNNGFTIKRETDIITELETAFKAAFGEINTNADSVFGQIIGVFSKPLAELWELSEAVYLSQYPASAEGLSLDGVAQLTGILRLGPTKTVVTGVLLGDQGTVVPAGSLASIQDTENIFQSTENKTIDKAEVLQCVISIGTVSDSQLYTITIDGTGHDYTSDASATAQEIVTGLVTNVNSGQSKVTAVDNGDETITITVDDKITVFSVDITAELDFNAIGTPVQFEAQNEGSILAVSGALSVIESPVSGWDSITNLTDGSTGNDTETDPDLRLRREVSLRVIGAATASAIEARLLQEVSNVTAVNILENDNPYYTDAVIVTIDTALNNTDYTTYINGVEFTITSDASATVQEIAAALVVSLNSGSFAITAADNLDGSFTITPDADGVLYAVGVGTNISLSGSVPPHSIECVVQGGIDQEVADKIFETIAAGIGTHGNVSATVQDSQGDNQNIKFSRPVSKYVHVRVLYTKNPEEEFPTDGEDQIKNNIYSFGLTQSVGDDVIIIKFYSPINDVPGISGASVTVDVTDNPGDIPSYGTSNISIGQTEIPIYDLSRIIITEV